MRLGRAAIAATFLTGCVVPLAPPAASAAVPAPAGVGAGASSGAGAHSLCAPPPDTVGPAITEVTFGRSSIDLNSGSRVQTIRATASDTSGNGDPSGVTRVIVEISGNRFSGAARLALVSGTRTSGHWTGRLVVSKYAHPGTYSIDYLVATDAAGNEQQYSGFGKVPEGPNALSLHPADDPTFTVTGTPAKRPARKPAGTLSAFSFSPSSVNTTVSKRRVHVTAHFTGAPPSHVFVNFDSARKTRHPRFVFLRAVLHDHHGTWSGTVRIPRWLGKQVLQPMLLADYGRGYRPSVRSYTAARLHRLHAPSKLTVISGVDNAKPRLKSLSFSPSSIDSTGGPEQVTVTAEATDARSGVRYIDVNGFIRHGVNGVSAGSYPFSAAGVGYLSSDDFHVRLRLSSSGDWVGTTKVRQCVPSGTYKLSVNVRDLADNDRNYSTKQLATAHITSTVDVMSKHGDVVAPYVYSAATYGPDRSLFLDFSEGVTNVSTSTLAVYPLSPASSRFTTPATVTNLKCSNGTHTVDCSGSGDLVTSAVLTVAGFKPGKKYDVYANLNQVTPQLTDGNGNPMQWNYAQTEVMDS